MSENKQHIKSTRSHFGNAIELVRRMLMHEQFNLATGNDHTLRAGGVVRDRTGGGAATTQRNARRRDGKPSRLRDRR